MAGLGFGFHQCFKACFVFGDSGVGFALDCFFEDYLPGVHVGSHVVEGAAVDLNVQRRVRRTIKDGMEGYVPAQPMRKKKAADDAFVDDIESSCIMKVSEVGVGFSQAREKNEFSWQSSHCIQLCAGCFKALSRLPYISRSNFV